MTEQHNSSPSLLDPARWGLPAEAVAELPDRLQCLWQRYRLCFHTRTRDLSRRAYGYLSALLRMEEKRNFAEIGRTIEQAGENIQHFMSNSSWQAGKVCQQVQTEIKATPPLHGGALLVDESADAKAGLCSAGSGRLGCTHPRGMGGWAR